MFQNVTTDRIIYKGVKFSGNTSARIFLDGRHTRVRLSKVKTKSKTRVMLGVKSG